MELKEILENVGLTKNESVVYLMLLEDGPSLAGQITKKTGIHRRNVYDVTLRLVEKGLVGYIVKNNRKVFEAVNPKKLKEILEERSRMLEENFDVMQQMFVDVKEKQETLFFTGKEGLKNIFEDQLKISNSEILILGASKSASEIFPFYFKWYDKDRVLKKIKVKIISSEKIERVPMSEIRYISGKFENPLAINIWGDNVALILWKAEPLAILIKNKDISDSYRKYFEAMWSSARR